MDTEDIILDALSDESQLNSADASGTVSNVADSLSLDDLNRTLGKVFPNKESALKSLKDTFSYVGKKKEAIENEVLQKLSVKDTTDKLATEIELMRKDRFYDKNPQYSSPEIRTIIEATGKSPEEVVNQEAFKNIFAKVQGYDESQKLKTVLESSPRLASASSNLEKARDLQTKQGGNNENVEDLVARAVREAYNF